MTSELTNKKQLRIALVGIAPADQVTLKGYMRVLLRLDVNLEWVSATESNIGLFMINNDFRNAESVARLLSLNTGVPTLYITSSPTDEGGLSQNLLTLPLKQVALLSDWLTKNVPILSGVTPTIGGTPVKQAVAEPAPTPLQASIGQARTTQPLNNVSMQTIIDLIEKIHGRSKSLFEITEGGVSIAVIDGHRQVAWVQSAQAVLSDRWQLRAYQGGLPNTVPVDANAWLWSVAWKNPNLITNLINNHNRYQLRYWVKPTQDRRELLQIMTAMESRALSVAEIAAKAGVSSTVAKNAVASLLLSGNLTDDSYKEIKVQTDVVAPSPSTSTTTQQSSIQPQSSPAPKPAEPPKPAPEQEEKMGFLARLRKKLGL